MHSNCREQFTNTQGPSWVGLLGLLHTSWRGMGHFGVLQTSCVPVLAFPRQKAQPWSGDCRLFSSPLLLLASSCACPEMCLYPSQIPHLPASLPGLQVSPRGGVKQSSTQPCVGCLHAVRLAAAAVGDRPRWWWDECRKSQSFGAGNEEKIPVVGEHCEQHHEPQMAQQLKRNTEEAVRAATEICFPKTLTLS